MRDLVSNIKTSVGDNGDSIDLVASDSVAVVGLTDPTSRILVSDEAAANFAAPAASDLTDVREDGGAFVVGYKGKARYIQAGASDIVVESHLHRRPQA